MVTVKVKFFGAVRGLTDGPTTEVQLGDESTLSELLTTLAEKYGKPFRDAVLNESNGLKGHIKLFINGSEVDSKKLATTKIPMDGAPAETMLYVMPSTAGG